MKINVNGVSLFYEKSGEGAPLILLHGNGENHHIFDEIAEKLQDSFTIYSIDSRNHGESQKTNDYSYGVMAEDIFEFIKALELGAVNIIGFSDGAVISLLLAMKHENIILKMALLGVNLKPEDFKAESYEFIKNTYEKTNDPLFQLMLEQPRIDYEDVMQIQIPTLIVAAENDIFKPEMFVKLSKSIPNSELKIMLGHEHDSYIVNQSILYQDFCNFFL